MENEELDKFYLGRRLKQVRNEEKILQETLCSAWGIKRLTLSRWENEVTPVSNKMKSFVEEFISTRGASIKTQLKANGVEIDGFYLGKRLKEIREEIKVSQETLYTAWGITRGTLNRWETEKTAVPDKMKPIVEEFIFTRGASIKSQFKAVADNGYLLSVPLVTTNRYNDFIYLDHYPKLNVDFYTNEKDSSFYLAFEILNDNMDNGLANGLKKGDIVLSKRVRKDVLKSNSDKNKVFVIVVDGRVFNASVVKYDNQSNQIVCHSFNDSPLYSDFEVNLKDVKDVYQVVRRNTAI